MADGLLARRALALGITSVLVGGGVPVLAHAALAAGPVGATSAASDTTAPTFVSSNPQDMDTVAPRSTVSATFNEPLASSSALRVVDNTGSQVAGSSTVPTDNNDTVVFTAATPLTGGKYTATADVKDAAGNPATATFTFTVDDTGPKQPTVVSGSANTNNATAYQVSGVTDANTAVNVRVTDSASMFVEKPTTSAPNGSYSVTQDVSTLKDGILTITVTATDSLGNTTTATSQERKDTVAPGTPVGATISPDPVTSVNGAVRATVTGSLAPEDAGKTNVTVLVTVTDGIDTTPEVRVTPDGNGDYTATVDVEALQDGPINAAVRVEDAAGNRSGFDRDSAKKEATKLALVSAQPKDGGTVRSAGLVTATYNEVLGDGTTGTKPQVTVVDKNGNTVVGTTSLSDDGRTAIFDGTGNFSSTNSPYTATFTVFDRGGEKLTNSETFTVDPNSPPSVTAASPVTQQDEDAFVVSGVAEKGAKITVRVTDSAGAVVSQTATAMDDGTYTTAPFSVASLADGTLNLSAVAVYTDNVTSRAGTGSVTKDTTGPAITGLSSTGTSSTSTTTTVTGKTAPSSVVKVTANDGDAATAAVAGTVTAGTDGTFTVKLDLSGLRAGTITVTAVATDTDGNAGPQASTTSTKSGTATGPTDLVTVTGTNGAAYQRTTPNGFSNLGGSLKSAPSIAQTSSDDYLFAIGSNDNVYVGEKGKAFRAFGPSGTVCQNVSAAVIGNTIAVACRGSNGALYVAKTTATAGQLPGPVARFTNLGGTSLAGTGPSVSTGSGAFRYTVVGTDHVVYSRTDSAGFSRTSGAPTCYSPAAVNGSGTVLACTNSSGGLQARKNGATSYTTLAGAVRGRIGTAVDPNGATRYYVVFSNNAVKVATQSASGAFSGFAASTGTVSTAGAFAVSLTK